MDYRKHSIIIVLAAIVSLALGGYLWFVPSISEEAEQLRLGCASKATSIEKIANLAAIPDGIKAAKHLDLATKFERELSIRTDETLSALTTLARLELFKVDAAKDNKEPFDIWMGNLRTKVHNKACDANLQLPLDIEQKMFRDTPTNEKSSDQAQTSVYRTRHLAIIEEVVNILSTKPIKAELDTFDAAAAVKGETPKKPYDLGAIALEKIIIGNPRQPSEKTPALEDVARRAGRTLATNSAKIQDLPYSVSSVDLVFTAPLATVPAYLKMLETSTRWLGTITRVDFKREAQPFPVPTDKKIEVAGPTPEANTYYREGPVKVLVTLEFYEHDKTREDEFNKALAKLK